MAANPIKRLLKTGLQNTVPILDFRRVLITNYLALFSGCGAVSMAIISLFLPFQEQAYLGVIGGSLYAFVFVLNKKRRYKAASVWFLILSVLVVLSWSMVSILYANSSGVENIFLAVMVVPLILFDGKEKNYSFWAIFLMLVAVRIMRYKYLEIPYDSELLLTILNYLFTSWFLFLFITFFKSVLLKAVETTNVHEKTLYSLLDNVPIFMALVDKESTYKIANRHYAEAFGNKRDEIIGKARSRILPEQLHETHKPYFDKALLGKTTSFLEKDEMPDGTSIFSRGTYVPIRNPEGEIEAISIYVDDVTELVEAQESLKRANETKDKLFSIIAHDIRSPLTLFQSMLNVSNEAIISQEDFLAYQKDLKGRLDSLSGRIDELLDWARMQMGGINAYPSEVDVNEVAKENADLFTTLIEKKNIAFETKLNCDVDGWMDQNHLQIVVRNLLHNALKFTEPGGTVTIETSQDDDSVLVEIVDSGAGIRKEMVDSILKREIQKSVVGTSGEVGTGLGLSLSLGLLEKNECILSLESEVGKGSIFRIWIPKSDINDPVIEN